MKKSKLSKLKKNEYFKFENSNKIYKYNGKVRMYNKWGNYKGFGYNYDDVNDVWSGGIDTFKDRVVLIDFEY